MAGDVYQVETPGSSVGRAGVGPDWLSGVQAGDGRARRSAQPAATPNRCEWYTFRWRPRRNDRVAVVPA